MSKLFSYITFWFMGIFSSSVNISSLPIAIDFSCDTVNYIAIVFFFCHHLFHKFLFLAFNFPHIWWPRLINSFFLFDVLMISPHKWWWCLVHYVDDDDGDDVRHICRTIPGARTTAARMMGQLKEEKQKNTTVCRTL